MLPRAQDSFAPLKLSRRLSRLLRILRISTGSSLIRRFLRIPTSNPWPREGCVAATSVQNPPPPVATPPPPAPPARARPACSFRPPPRLRLSCTLRVPRVAPAAAPRPPEGRSPTPTRPASPRTWGLPTPGL